MKISGVLIALLYACVSPLFAVTAKIVASDGSPIAAATLLLLENGASALSDDSGIVVLNSIATIPGIATSGARFGIHNGRAQLNLRAPADVDIAIVSLAGRSLWHRDMSLAAGMHNLQMPLLSNGLYLLKASIGNALITAKINTAKEFSWSGDAGVSMSGGRIASVAAVQSVIDTAVFSKDGYVTVRRPIASYAENIGTVVLIPTGIISTPAQFAGNWSGTYTGSDSGTWVCTVDSSGVLTGSITGLFGTFTLSGSVDSTGDFNATTGSASSGSTFTGQTTSSSAVSGTWQNSSPGIYGDFAGTKQSFAASACSEAFLSIPDVSFISGVQAR